MTAQPAFQEHVSPLFRFADTDGDGTGTKSAIGDYSGAAEEFYIQPQDGTVFYISRCLISYEDTTGMQAQEYGNIGAALTNGITLKKVNASGTIDDLTDGVPIKTNAHWGRDCFDVDVKSWGSGNELLCARWTFSKSGTNIKLDGSKGEKLVFTLNDAFDDLISQYFCFQGFKTGKGVNRE